MISKINKLDLVIAIYIFIIVASELMGSKTFPLIDFAGIKINSSVAIFLMPFLFTINDVVVEVYGKKRAKSLVYSGLIVIVLLILYSLLVVHLPASGRFTMSQSYNEVFSLSIRISLASIVAFIFSELIDIAVFSKLRSKISGALWLRNNLSNFIAQLVDTTIFYFLAFYAPAKPFSHNLSFLAGLIFSYWLVKCMFSLIETPFVYWGVAWLKNEKN
ncbi:MAG: hypothetical protein UT48_C0001G0078 [Parcubacteria group bacterium GW2011_GWE2_39_37]|uniref:Probable queuosine precursor transporter n=1 Tax=Candidatus Falkowbacteria bacterium GW2011_GWF2_39_8 TaxID=1618642 RepID=A0A0G0Q0M8_9BACT|nr:MAG: hypothetical protein UT48_C0001G0078 [Parcubacteria group bacterium GW2011_GWE2_39_37]KKR33713.1 MAG: hypothetical protein UT64_C0004G0020 [Candidatus Falkowbacteria bacterium GW2011_GWF2_39_8]